MSFKIIAIILLIGITKVTFAQSALLHKTEWTIKEVTEWAQNSKNTISHGWLLYQGSDSISHHFISRVMDEFESFSIKRAELKIDDERKYFRASTAPLGYYYVDATKDFVKVKDY